jgi:hypothetical protein
MADELEKTLAAGIESDEGLKAMAAKLAPRAGTAPEQMVDRLSTIRQPVPSVEARLQEIERLVREIRAVSAQVKGLLG